MAAVCTFARPVSDEQHKERLTLCAAPAEASASKSSGKAKAPVVVLVAAAIIAGGIYLFRRQRANRPEKKK